MERLHAGHAGQDKTIKLAQQLYFCQNMSNDIKTIINNCNECQRKPPSKTTNQPKSDKPAHTRLRRPNGTCRPRPVSLLRHETPNLHRQWSRFPLYKRLNSTSTQSLINILENWFNILGWPSNIRSDGGPQFLGPFRRWCQEKTTPFTNCPPLQP